MSSTKLIKSVQKYEKIMELIENIKRENQSEIIEHDRIGLIDNG